MLPTIEISQDTRKLLKLPVQFLFSWVGPLMTLSQRFFRRGPTIPVARLHSSFMLRRCAPSLAFHRLSQPTLCGLQSAQERRFRL